MERSAIRDSFRGDGAPDYASLHAGYKTLRRPSGKTPKRRVNPTSQKDSALPKFGFGVFVSPPHPCHRGVSRSSRTGGELRWTLVTSARRASQGGKTVSEGVAHTTGADSVRQNRVVLTPGVCVSSLVVMWTARPGI